MAEASKQDAKAGEEPSMEEILQSIKKIIAEDDPDGKASEPLKAGDSENGEVAGSDVLELTDALPEEKPTEKETKEAAVPAAKEAAPAPAGGNDVLNKIDEALAVEKKEEPAAAPKQNKPAADETLLSDQAAIAAGTAVKKLQTAAEPPLPEVNTSPSPEFLSGNSVERMVMDMLKPMMKEWLDTNLPAVVERIVTVEIRKLTK